MEEIKRDAISKLRYDMSFMRDYNLNKNNFDLLCANYYNLQSKLDNAIKVLEEKIEEINKNFNKNNHVVKRNNSLLLTAYKEILELLRGDSNE